MLAKSEDLFSAIGYLGEAPQLSTKYAEYDNGVKVFADYVNNNTYNLYMPNSTSPTTIDYTFSAITSGEILYQGYIASLNSTGNNFILFASDSPTNVYRTGTTSFYNLYSNGLGIYSPTINNKVSVDTRINFIMNVSTNSSYVSFNQNNAGWVYLPSGYTLSSTSSVYIENLISNTYSDEILGRINQWINEVYFRCYIEIHVCKCCIDNSNLRCKVYISVLYHTINKVHLTL